jgi:replicative DNA helicase
VSEDQIDQGDQIKIFTSIRGENKLLKGLICHESQDNQSTVRHIEKVILDSVSPDCFTSDFRGWLYSTIVTHYQAYASALTYDLIYQKIVKRYKKKQAVADARSLLDKILNRTFDSSELSPLIDELVNLQQIRKVSETVEDVLTTLRAIKEGTVNVSAAPLVTKLERAISDINSQSQKERIIEEDAFSNVDQDMEFIRDCHDNPEKYKGIATGIEPLTLSTGGWHGGDLITVIGRTGQGKSIVMLNFAYSAWEAGNNVLYVSIEMPLLQQKRRLYSRMTGVDYFKVKNAHLLTNEQLIYIEEKVKKLRSERDNVFMILDAPSMCTARFIEQRILNFEKTTGRKIQFVVVDPIYLMKPNEPDDDLVGAVSWDLKLMGRKLDVPVMNANQINREGHKRHLLGKDMDAMDSASSDRLGQNSDIMLGIFSDDNQWLKMSLVKYRDGRGPVLYLKRQFDQMKIEYDPEYNQNEEVMTQITGEKTADDSDD